MKDSTHGIANTMEVTKSIPTCVLGVQDSDKNTAYIDLSNKCREFYQTRMKAAEAVKQKLNSNNDNRNKTARKKSTIDTAMETLRAEMASLIDQDLLLMKQLLTLNETIEEIKSQHRYYHSRISMRKTSRDLEESEWSISETDMYDAEHELSRKYSIQPAFSIDSWLSKKEDSEEDQGEAKEFLHLNLCSDSDSLCSDSDNLCSDNLYETKLVRSLTDGKRFIETEFLVSCSVTYVEHNSLDSVIYEPVRSKEVAV